MIRFNIDPMAKMEEISDVKNKRELIQFQTPNELSGFFKKIPEDIKKDISRGNLLSLKSGTKTYVPRNAIEINQFVELFNQAKKDDGYVITVANAKGGVLKTTNTSNIGASLAFLGKKVLLIDGDVTQCSLSSHYSANNNPDEKNYLTSILLDIQDGELVSNSSIRTRVKDALFNVDTSDKFTQGTLDILPSTLKLKNRSKYIDTNNSKIISLDKLIQTIKSEYDFIIIDTPPSAVSPLIDLSYFASDYALLSLKAEPETLDTAIEIVKPIIDINSLYNKNCQVVGAIYGQYTNTNISKASIASVTEFLTQEVATQFMIEVVSYSPTMPEVQLGGIGASILLKPKSKVSSEYLDIAVQIMSHSIALGGE